MDEKILENEQEWRRAIWGRLDKIDDRLADLRIKVAIFSSTMSILTAISFEVIRAVLK